MESKRIEITADKQHEDLCAARDRYLALAAQIRNSTNLDPAERQTQELEARRIANAYANSVANSSSHMARNEEAVKPQSRTINFKSVMRTTVDAACERYLRLTEQIQNGARRNFDPSRLSRTFSVKSIIWPIVAATVIVTFFTVHYWLPQKVALPARIDPQRAMQERIATPRSQQASTQPMKGDPPAVKTQPPSPLSRGVDPPVKKAGRLLHQQPFMRPITAGLPKAQAPTLPSRRAMSNAASGGLLSGRHNFRRAKLPFPARMNKHTRLHLKSARVAIEPGNMSQVPPRAIENAPAGEERPSPEMVVGPAAKPALAPLEATRLVSIAGTHTLPRFPPFPARIGKSGVTRLKITISAAGKPTDCEVVGGSESEILDRVACRHVLDAWRWEPPTVQGRPVDATTSVTLSWKLAN